MMDTAQHQHVGSLLRDWRQRRRLSQLDLALDADISARHLSFVETGRAQPSREMILLLAEQLEVPLRERNALLLAGGFAPVFAERALGDPALAAARGAVELVLSGHEPFPALAVDRHWHMVAANGAVGRLLGGVAPELLAPPVNVLRLSLHPDGLASRIVNLAEWRAHLLARLDRQAVATADPVLVRLLQELESLPSPPPPSGHPASGASHAAEATVFVPLRLAVAGANLAFLGTTTVFGTPRDITLSELAVEAFFPADAATADFLRSTAA